MAASPEAVTPDSKSPDSTVNVQDVFVQMQSRLEKRQYSEALKASILALEASKGLDMDALLVRVHCLSQLSQWGTALKVIEEACSQKRSPWGSDKAGLSEVTQRLLFDRLYVLYKLKRYKECLESLDQLPQSSTNQIEYLHLKAQVVSDVS
eukprot:GHVN01072786.1.p1 GENE.GHVN01072786.1~~GHVN01072786.1.p1  ORF type:complete len:173 (-),score=32.92 GHVN01072786.1:306-758(-)